MRIIVLMKEVPDTYGDRVLDLETGLAARAASEAVPDEICERALEAALAYADSVESDSAGGDSAGGVEVTVVMMAPAGAASTLRKVLAVGADSGVHVVGDALSGADAGLTAEVLAAAVRRSGADLVLAGNASTDGAGGVVPAMLAELLEMPLLSGLSELRITADAVSGVRPVEGGVQKLTAPLPAVVSVTEALPAARFPNFKGILAAKKKPVEVLSPEDLGVDAGDLSVPRSIMLSIAERPPRAAGLRIVDAGDAGEQLADFLIENRLV